MPGCGALDRGGQIKALGFVLFALLLLWLEQPATVTTTTSNNKVEVTGGLRIGVIPVLFYLPLTGRGGEGIEMVGLVMHGSGGVEGAATLAHVRGAGWWPFSPSVSFCLPLVDRGGGGKETATWRRAGGSLSFKRCRHYSDAFDASLIFLAGRGGKGEDAGCSVRFGDLWWLGRLLELVPPAADPKRRLTAAIQGHMDGPVVLCSGGCKSVFSLFARVFSSPGMVVCAPSLPSGPVPGERWSGRAWRLVVAGVKQGLDRVSVILFRVFFVKSQDLVGFSLLYEVLSVNVHPAMS